MFLQVLTVEKILPHQPRTLNSTFTTPIVVPSVALVIATVYIRLKMVGPALDTLSSTTDDAIALAKWRKGVVLSDVLLDVVVLYGFCLAIPGRDAAAVLAVLRSRYRTYGPVVA